MDKHQQKIKSKQYGDLYLLMNKNKLQKFDSLRKQVYKKRYRLSPNDTNKQNNEKLTHSLQKEITEKQLKLQEKIFSSPEVLKNSDTLIVQQTDENHNPMNFEANTRDSTESPYKIKITHCQCQTKEISPLKNKKKGISSDSSFIGRNKQYDFNYPNFIKFFNFVIDFKLLNVQSYSTRKILTTESKVSQLKTPLTKKAPNSLISNNLQLSSQKIPQSSLKNSLQRTSPRKSLQTSQMSIVDVRVSTTSIDDEIIDREPFPSKKTTRKYHSISLIQRAVKSKTQQIHFQKLQNGELQQQQIVQYSDISKSKILFKSQNFGVHCSSSKIVSISQLKQKIDQARQLEHKARHQGFYCNQCQIQPILGKRYKCTECQDYDLCEHCYKIQCSKFKIIMKRYNSTSNYPSALTSPAKSHANSRQSLPSFTPNLKKDMSKISEEQGSSPNFSPSGRSHISSQGQNNQDHIHIMQQVVKCAYQNLVDLSKVLRQTNSPSPIKPQRLLSCTQKSSNSGLSFRGLSHWERPKSSLFLSSKSIKTQHIDISRSQLSKLGQSVARHERFKQISCAFRDK